MRTHEVEDPVDSKGNLINQQAACEHIIILEVQL